MSAGDPHLYEAIGAVREHLHGRDPDPEWSGELGAELARASEHVDDAEPVEFAPMATPLEKNGWVLHCETRAERLAHGILSEMERLRELAAADEEIDAFRRGERSESDVEQARQTLHVD